MANINNNYKRFQTYRNEGSNTINTFKQNYMEQNYKIEKRSLPDKKELSEKKELPKIDKSFIERSSRIGINSQGQFFKK